jgi:hypothetical protein
MKTTILALLTITAFLVSCSRDNGPFPTKILVGVNDSAIYHFDRDGRTAGVEKLRPILESYSYLQRDTVELGDEFSVYFSIYKDDFQIIISEPTQDTLTRADMDNLKEAEPFGYYFKTTRTGTFDFKGEFRFDTTVRPIDWKFIVVEGD